MRYKLNCYFLHTLLLVLMLLFIFAIICYLYTNDRSKQENTGTLNTKMKKNNEINNIGFKNRMCYLTTKLKLKILILIILY